MLERMRYQALTGAIAAAVITACLWPAGSVSAAAHDWPNWRGPDYSGISEEADWDASWSRGEPKVLWRKNIGKGFSSYAISDGRAFVMGNIKKVDHVWCFDAENGEEIWKHTYACKVGGHPGPRATPTVDGERVYTLSREGHLFCFNVENGDIVWKKNVGRGMRITVPGWGFAGSPVVEGKMLLINVGTAGMALNKLTGEVIWKTGRDKAGFSTPVVFDHKGKRCVAVFAAKALYGLDAKTGDTLWRFPWKTKYDVNAVTPVVFDEKVFISSDYGTGCALVDISGDSPKQIWRNKNMKNHFNNCVLWKGHLYGIDSSTLKCISAKTGEEKWSWRRSGKGSLMMADRKLIVLSDKGVLSIAPATPAGFRPVSQAKVVRGLCWTVPVLANGRIYVRSREGDSACLDVGADN